VAVPSKYYRKKEIMIFPGSLRNNSYSPEMIDMLICQQSTIKQEREIVKIHKFHLHTKFTTEIFKQTKVAFQTKIRFRN
jgi:hypothetical protein